MAKNRVAGGHSASPLFSFQKWQKKERNKRRKRKENNN